ncbi:hypothetical protein [Pareuzebyella sediminis]|uniref:hypothetical protein n=1 Tax=Pareuzebyella sediminis TaxID=2607998 RepID=UPI0011EC5372|nr:hypothetical protein [Pareuzebyella sediminis]
MSKGGKRPGAGRPKGSTNRKADKIRDFYQLLINKNLKQLQEDLDTLKPKERLEVIISLSKFVVPMMKAVEMSGRIDSPKIDMSKWK